MARANVVMSNLSPLEIRKKYILYDSKVDISVEAVANIRELKNRMASIGYEVIIDQGGHKRIKDNPCP